jgi:hypothetical protein
MMLYKDPAKIGVELGLLLTVGFGGGVLIGGACDVYERFSKCGAWSGAWSDAQRRHDIKRCE